MKQTFGLSWDHGKRKLIAAIALLLIAITLAATPTASGLQASRSFDSGVSVHSNADSFSHRGSTWG
jgi:hypothetical protein